MATNEVLAVDLGQSGCRIKQGDSLVVSDRGKLAGETPDESLTSIFSELSGMQAEEVARVS